VLDIPYISTYLETYIYTDVKAYMENFQSIMLSDGIQTQKIIHYVFHLYKISRIGKFIEAGGRLVVTRNGGRKRNEE
jgi:isochorismate hydrolase